MYDWKCVSGGAVERRCFLVKNDLFFLLHEILLFLRSAFSQFLLLREAKQRKKEMNKRSLQRFSDVQSRKSAIENDDNNKF